MDDRTPPPAARSVLLTADTVGGVWTYAVELAAQLCASGLRVHLATMGAPLVPEQRAQITDLDSLALHESSWRLEWMPEPWDDLAQAGRWLLALEAEHRPDVVHVNQFAFGALPFAAPTLLVAHSCVLSWWQAVHGTAAPATWDRYRQLVARGLASANQVAAPTRAMRDTLAVNHGFTGRACVLPNGRDPALFAPATKQAFILAAGRLWDEAKNLAALEAVAASLPWPVRVAGGYTDPEGREHRPRAVQALGLLSQPALARQMAQAAVYALPARYEPFGLSVLEAALSGCALVLGDIPSLRETWDGAALFVAPDDHAELRDALCTLAADAPLRQQLAEAARTRAAGFTSRRMALATQTAYSQLLAQRSPAPQEASACA
jgi:glycogen(starch) synthase